MTDYKIKAAVDSQNRARAYSASIKMSKHLKALELSCVQVDTTKGGDSFVRVQLTEGGRFYRLFPICIRGSKSKVEVYLGEFKGDRVNVVDVNEDFNVPSEDEKNPDFIWYVDVIIGSLSMLSAIQTKRYILMKPVLVEKTEAVVG
jgi:hypothetical protein